MSTSTEVIIEESNQGRRLGVIVFIAMALFHLGALLGFKVGISPIAFIIFFISYLIKGFGITMGFHRYFAHRSFKTSRIFQFVLALMGTSAIQGGVLWWGSHHRAHHKHSDQEADLHSPVIHSFFHSHLGWMWDEECFAPAKYKLLDFSKYSEIKFLNSYYAPLVLVQALLFYLLGELLNNLFPTLGTNGMQTLVWGFFIATVWTWHITFSINSICHIFGKKRYHSKDESKNNWTIAILALGEGWHNNHHKYGWSARNGFFWYEFDPTYYLLIILERFGIVWDLKAPSKEQLNRDLINS